MKLYKTKRLIQLMVLSLAFLNWHCQKEVSTEPISFNESIRPIFNAKCLNCHGGVKQLGGYSLLFQEEAYDTTDSGIYGIVPGQPENSAVYQRIVSEDPLLRMPLDHPPLDEASIQTIKNWIQQGAKWEDHWAFIPPKREIPIPSYESSSWVQNPIDAFVLRKLTEKQLNPSSRADAATLIRRIYLDLTGLPPSSDQVESYLSLENPNVLDQVIEDCLISVHYGEHWASMWLDLARYGDSQGYQKDPLRRHIWRYRDWVIHAFNKDMPFDTFTIEQLAGDLLEDPTDHQILATAFHRNTNTNDEGGTDNEEFRVAAVLDRVNTTYEVWQGVTMSCVQCHTHPYDPILHKEFYQSMAFFNNTQDADLPSDAPRHTLLSPGQSIIAKSIQEQINPLQKKGDTLSENYQTKLKALLANEPGPVPIMKEFHPDSGRVTRVFIKGNWLSHGDTVTPNTPKSLHHFQETYPKNRLGFAQWLVAENNPLTARVIVNRLWAKLFGRGLVETVEDFGTQGSPPTHPELLDWLANELMYTHKWHLKSFLKMIVSSASYQQSSEVTAEILAQDPNNKWLSRGPRFRLSAEQLRDQALTVSGLLSKKIYGPSVMPYQPDGVWNTIRKIARWNTSKGEDQYRRGLYTFVRKTSPYPSTITFDGVNRLACVSRRIRTNTPLQAMVTLNDPVYVEAAKSFALSIMEKFPDDPEASIKYGYQTILFKEISPEKLKALLELYHTTKNTYELNPSLTRDLIEEVHLSSPSYAALINVSSVLLNLDEFLNKT